MFFFLPTLTRGCFVVIMDGWLTSFYAGPTKQSKVSSLPTSLYLPARSFSCRVEPGFADAIHVYMSTLVKELSFDISRFNSKMYKVSEFVYSLINHHENEDLLSYEPTIRYAEFPALDLSPDERRAYGDNTYLPYGNTEVVKALGWLRKKGVERIIELKVPDRMVNSYTEQQIAGFAKDFKIEILDWRFIDLSLSLFDHDVKDRIRELHLYSSGKWAPVRHWLSSDGISTLPNVSSILIHQLACHD